MVGEGSWLSSAAGLWLLPKSQPPLLKVDKYSPGVVYLLAGHWSFVTVSPILNHGPEAIWAHLEPILVEVRQTHPNISVLHFYSDGPTTQYRNKLNFYFCTRVFELGFNYATWNLFEAGRGKGAPDGIGGSIKRTADCMVLNGVDIPDAQTFYQLLSASESAIKLYYVSDKDIQKMKNMCPGALKPISGTMKIHQLWTLSSKKISYRCVSCFCSRPTQCTCSDLANAHFRQGGQNKTRDSTEQVNPEKSGHASPVNRADEAFLPSPDAAGMSSEMNIADLTPPSDAGDVPIDHAQVSINISPEQGLRTDQVAVVSPVPGGEVEPVSGAHDSNNAESASLPCADDMPPAVMEKQSVSVGLQPSTLYSTKHGKHQQRHVEADISVSRERAKRDRR